MELKFLVGGTIRGEGAINTVVITKGGKAVTISKELLAGHLRIPEGQKSISIAEDKEGNYVILNNPKNNNFNISFPPKGNARIVVNGALNLKEGRHGIERGEVIMDINEEATPYIIILPKAEDNE